MYIALHNFHFHLDTTNTTNDDDCTMSISFALALFFSLSISCCMPHMDDISIVAQQERECKAKLLQFVSGVNVFTFWMTSFLWDYFTYFITTILLVATLAAFQEDGWSSPAELGRTLLVFLLFGFAMLPMTFLAAKFFTIPSTGFTRMTMINIFTGTTSHNNLLFHLNDNFPQALPCSLLSLQCLYRNSD